MHVYSNMVRMRFKNKAILLVRYSHGGYGIYFIRMLEPGELANTVTHDTRRVLREKVLVSWVNLSEEATHALIEIMALVNMKPLIPTPEKSEV